MKAIHPARVSCIIGNIVTLLLLGKMPRTTYVSQSISSVSPETWVRVLKRFGATSSNWIGVVGSVYRVDGNNTCREERAAMSLGSPLEAEMYAASIVCRNPLRTALPL